MDKKTVLHEVDVTNSKENSVCYSFFIKTWIKHVLQLKIESNKNRFERDFKDLLGIQVKYFHYIVVIRL